ncbi:MAG: DUF6268 family outer membrane beta-barrel protein [Planctomycetia bacterium]|nr:DUF6268 family outer membrane beta-barrel protein [Planctomycetia bacterium]
MPPVQESPPLFSGNGAFASNPFQYDSDTSTGPRLFQHWGTDLTWITTSSDGGKKLGLFRLSFDGEITIPIFALEHPLYFKPRFAVNYWNGPQSDIYDMPPQTFDASLGLAWQPQWKAECLGGTEINFDLYFSVGIYSDFRKVSGKSFRFPSYGYFSLKLTPNVQLKLGVYYLDRVRYKISPAGGLIWTPNNQWEFQFLFPNPQVTYRPEMSSFNNLVLYARGEYGGGSWTIKHMNGRGVERVDYNDYRIMFGGSWVTTRRHEGYFEIGLSFARELYYSDLRSHSVNAGFIMSGGFHF